MMEDLFEDLNESNNLFGELDSEDNSNITYNDDNIEEENLFEDLTEQEICNLSKFQRDFESEVIYKVPEKLYKSLDEEFSEEEIFDKFLSDLVFG